MLRKYARILTMCNAAIVSSTGALLPAIVPKTGEESIKQYASISQAWRMFMHKPCSAWHGTTQHSTAQHSTAQHSTVHQATATAAPIRLAAIASLGNN